MSALADNSKLSFNSCNPIGLYVFPQPCDRTACSALTQEVLRTNLDLPTGGVVLFSTLRLLRDVDLRQAA